MDKAVVRINSRLLPILVIVLFVISLLDDYPGWRLLLTALGSAWLIGYLWARSLARGLRVKRAMRYGWAQVGDRLEESYEIDNRSHFPCLWIEIEDHSNLPGYNPSQATGVSSDSKQHYFTQGVCSQRGLFTIGPTSWCTSDPFHFYTVEQHNSNTIQLMVTPPVVPLPGIQVAPGGRAGEGRPRPNAPQQTVSSAGVRQYVLGDSSRWIHWPTSARRGELYVRQFDNIPAGDWWIILDIDRSTQAGQAPDSTDEHGIILAASLADRGLRLGKNVGLAAYGQPLIWLPPCEGDAQRWRILRSLATLQPADYPLDRLLAGIRPNLGIQTSLVIITANTSPAWLEALLPMIWQGAAPTVLLLDPLAFSGQGQTVGFEQPFEKWGVRCYRITPELLNRPEAHPGHRGQLEWRFTPTGKAILLTPRREMAWKVIS